MVISNVSDCPNCGGYLKYYDSVPRTVRTKGRATRQVKIRRLRCSECKSMHRELPDYILPYKQYEAPVINGVLDGSITPETIECEDYPCEVTMLRWMKSKDEFY